MITIDLQRCKGCELCIPVCPKNIISIGSTLNQQGYYVAFAQHMERCTGCALCAEVCPDIAITVYEHDGKGIVQHT
jgi:2-oxoglutarate ferredoxin oxidoreductase subunit delta